MTTLADILRNPAGEAPIVRRFGSNRVAERAVVTTRFAFEIASATNGNFADRVDKSNAVIRGVKIIGLDSRNTGRTIGLDAREFGPAADKPYSYTPEALRGAIPLYEGAHVFSNHTKFDFDQSGARVIKSTERDNDDLIGWISEVHYVDGQGLYGNLHYIAAHPMSNRLCEIADRNPTLLALSHEAVFDQPQVRNGKIYLTKINGVDSVALVSSKPGTTNGLFESFAQETGTMTWTTTLREILESTPADTKGRKVLEDMIAEAGAAPNPVGDAPVNVPPSPNGADMGPQEKIRQGMLAAVNAKLEDADVDSLRKVLQALQLSDSIAECSSRRPPNVQEEAPTEAAPPPDAAAPAMDAQPPAAAPTPPAQESAPPQETPAECPAGPGMSAAPSDAPPPAGPAGSPEKPPAEPPFLKKDQKTQESAAVVDRSGLVIECADLLTQHGIPATGVVLEAMIGLPTTEKRTEYATKLAESHVRDAIPANMRIPRSAPSPAPQPKPVAESLFNKPGDLASFLRSRPASAN